MFQYIFNVCFIQYFHLARLWKTCIYNVTKQFCFKICLTVSSFLFAHLSEKWYSVILKNVWVFFELPVSHYHQRMACLMAISIIRHTMNILRKHAVIWVCSQVNAEVSSALHQLCSPQQPVEAACEVCEGADSDEPQQCTCKCVFLVQTYHFTFIKMWNKCK